MSGHVYLLTELDNEKYYKIGVTKKDDIKERLNELQTGNSSELFIIKSFKTKYPYKLEKWLHLYFNSKHKLNEWYELESNDIDNFINICEKYENMFKSLKENPFFKK